MPLTLTRPATGSTAAWVQPVSRSAATRNFETPRMTASDLGSKIRRTSTGRIDNASCRLAPGRTAGTAMTRDGADAADRTRVAGIRLGQAGQKQGPEGREGEKGEKNCR